MKKCTIWRHTHFIVDAGGMSGVTSSGKFSINCLKNFIDNEWAEIGEKGINVNL